jgi:hypothetical protein
MSQNSDFLPTRDADFALWATNMSQRLAAGGLNPYGLLPAQVTGFQALYGTWNSAWLAASQNVTRTPGAIQVKDDAREALTSGPNGIRQLVAIIQADPDTTNEDRVELQITVRDPEPSPVPIPTQSPLVSVTNVNGRVATVRLGNQAEPTRRGKPTGVSGATLFYYVGETAPTEPDQWTYLIQTTRTILDVVFPDSIQPWTKVWLSALWYNTKAQTSPASAAVSFSIGDTYSQKQAEAA